MNYHDDTSTVSKTMLAHFHGSTLEYWRYYVGQVEKPPQPKAAIVGSIAHEVLLKGRRLSDVARIYPLDCLKKVAGKQSPYGAINPKPAREFEESLPEGEHAVKTKVYDQCQALLDAVKDHPVVKLIETAEEREQPVYWTDVDTAIDCRCRPDFLCLTDEGAVCYDLKFTTQVKPNDFWRTARTLRYWMQDAHYSAGVKAHFSQPCKFVFWAIEDSEPHRVARYEYTPDSRENAAIETSATLRQLARCTRTNDWEDDWTRHTNQLLFDVTEANLELPEEVEEGSPF